MRRILLLSMMLLFCISANALTSNDHFDVSPFFGSWSWTTSTGCTETYIFYSNGILQIKSGGELTDSKYQILKPTTTKQLAKLTFKTIKDFGGQDCAKSTSDSTGQSAEMYIGITPDGTEMLNCDTAEATDCWRLKKVKGNK